MTKGLIKLYGINKQGTRYMTGMIDKDSIEDISINEVRLGPLDPDDPEGKLRLQVPDEEKERMMVIKIFKKGPPILRPNKQGDMEVVPFRQLWYKWDDGERELKVLEKALE